jgi:hypothetical protein
MPKNEIDDGPDRVWEITMKVNNSNKIIRWLDDLCSDDVSTMAESMLLNGGGLKFPFEMLNCDEIHPVLGRCCLSVAQSPVGRAGTNSHSAGRPPVEEPPNEPQEPPVEEPEAPPEPPEPPAPPSRPPVKEPPNEPGKPPVQEPPHGSRLGDAALPENRQMLKLARKIGFQISQSSGGN